MKVLMELVFDLHIANRIVIVLSRMTELKETRADIVFQRFITILGIRET